MQFYIIRQEHKFLCHFFGFGTLTHQFMLYQENLFTMHFKIQIGGLELVLHIKTRFLTKLFACNCYFLCSFSLYWIVEIVDVKTKAKCKHVLHCYWKYLTYDNLITKLICMAFAKLLNK